MLCAESPLHLLAQVALNQITNTANQGTTTDPLSHPPAISSNLTLGLDRNLHIYCGLSACSSSGRCKCLGTKPFIGPGCGNTKRRKQHQYTSMRALQKAKVDIKARRRAYKYALLRVVYDEITTYPSESWMILMALVIHRSFKQVKNWFSNERQKHEVGQTVWIHTNIGEKVRLRPWALELCQDWSDGLFEGVIRIHHFRMRHCS